MAIAVGKGRIEDVLDWVGMVDDLRSKRQSMVYKSCELLKAV